ncbi:sodium leak channel non-selective protein-like [Dendronephthya gigantea]|uniref:sodium leak channel non-selective protein-like n=1 Tax=Dendronephthya gigantea TaxID=151771 RepID=UPI00106C1783|nr:sodium leak channel non-selective protein-like [Dendronephthya gigantea]
MLFSLDTSLSWPSKQSKMEADTGDASDLASDVSNSKIPTNTAVESSGPEDDEHDDDELPSVQFVKSVCFKRLIQISIVVSAISVGMNSKKTFEKYRQLWYVTLTLDIFVLLIFLIESLMDMKIFGLWKGERAFLKNRFNLFNLGMLIFIVMSIVLQIVEGPNFSGYVPEYLKVIARAPRSFILIRVMKYFMNISLLNQVSRRSGKQIRNVTTFLVYFMILASLIGVQLFGEESYYCVKNGTDIKNVTNKDLNLPEIRCYIDNSHQSKTVCPEGFVCHSLRLDDSKRTTYFENIWYGFLTVYESSTQEGWVLVMYAQMNSQNYYVSAVYFVSLIFFVAWLVKSVFIAVITETFADLRSQLYLKNWRTNRRITGLSSEIIQDDGTGWHLVAIKEEWTKTKAFNRARQFLTSKYFRYMIWALLALDALLQPNLDPHPRRILQLVFTIIFDIESCFKIWCVGVKSYWKIPVYRFELFLAVGSTLCIGAVTYAEADILVAFHVLRVTRLIIAVPSLNAFLHKAFGTGTKIGAVVIFTLFLLVFASTLSLQLFSGMDFGNDGPFDDYLKSSTSMFQIITQEGWVEVLDTVKYASSPIIAPLVSIYFTSYNLFASLILGSVFIAVILDNLEIKEETKILKQRKLGEEGLNIHESLPKRLQIFGKFKESPRLVETWKVSGDFPVPKVRQSFMRKFLDDTRMRLSGFTANPSVYEDALMTQRKDMPFKLLSSPVPDDVHTLRLKKRTSLTQLIQDSTRRRNLTDYTATQGRHTAKSYLLGYTARQINRNAAKLTQGARKTSEKADMNALRQMKSQGGHGAATLPHNTGSSRNNEDWNIRELRARREQAQRVKAAREESLRENHPYFDFPLFIVSRDSLLRQWLQRIVHARYEIAGNHGEVQSKRPMINDAFIKRVLSTQTYLEWIIILITFSSCVAMMFEKHDYRTFDVPVLEFFEYLFVVATSIELLIRVLADGLLFTPNAVIRSPGDVMDISIYFIGFIYVCLSPSSIPRNSATYALLVLRALRPLRVINLIPKTRQVIQELFGGFKEILKVAALQLSLMFIFASYGVQMFSNKLKRCNDDSVTTEEECQGFFYTALRGPQELRELAGGENEMLVSRTWHNPKSFNFDELLNALIALFEALSLEGWLDIRNVIEDQKNLGTLYGFYIHGYVLLACMIGLAMFVGVVVNNFNENKGTALLTVDQRRWEDLRKRLRLAQPLHLPLRPDDSPVRSRLYDFLQSTLYGRVNVFLVVFNCATLAVVPWIVDPDSPIPKNLMLISVALTIVFVIECILKIVAYTFRGYWRSHRNRFDFFLTVAGVLWIILHFAFVHNHTHERMYRGPVWLGVAIILFRFLSLSGKHDTLKMLMMTVLMSLVKSFYIIFVLVLIIMSYAMIGVIVFGTVKHGVAINNDANFEGSINAMIMLFRITTGEDWNKVRQDCGIQEPYCTEATESENYWKSDCGTYVGSLCYFISFYVTLTFVLLNLLIAVIIENFSLFYSSEEDAALSHQDLYQYQLTWNLVDQNRKGFITVRQARLVLRLLRGRLGVDPSTFLFKHICLEIEKFRGGREVSFHDLLEILAYRSIDDISRSLQLEELLAREELERSIEEEVAIQTIRDWFLNLKKEKAVKRGRGYSFGAISSASSVETESSDNEDQEQSNRLSVKTFQKRNLSSKTQTPSISVVAVPQKGEEKVEQKDEGDLEEWFTNQIT